MTDCKIKGPYLPFGDVDWVCSTHNVLVELIDPTKDTDGVYRREDFFCPVSASRS